MSASPQDLFRRADAIFDAALDLPSGERTAWVELTCAPDDELRDRVLRLLRAHARSASFLEAPALELAAPLLPDELFDPGVLPAGGTLGPFRLLRPLGRGGMGTVYLAERTDADLHQRVALKRIHAGAADGAFVRRFLAERRIVAMLEHPAIARLIDGGVGDDGVPWFAMELVEGEPIDRYCDAHRLGVAARLGLFAQVCDAVEYAHRHLVVHRDLKPANILVTDDGHVKLLDFGIARLLAAGDERPGDAPTAEELHAMTPEHASPEQVRGLPVTTATDVYGLGVLLYQLLTGVRPHDLGGRSAADIERIICDTEPAAPSSTLSADDAAGRAAARATTPDRLRRTLRGDLDLIVRKALAKDADRRYPSAAALSEDLRRWREGRPIVARAPGTGYRLRRFIRRQRVPVGAGILLLTLLAGAAMRERTLRGRAEAETRKARAVEEFLVGVFDLADPFAPPLERGSDVTARTLLDHGAARIDSDLSAEPAVRAELRGVLGRVFASLGLYDQAVPMLERALEEQRALYGGEHTAVADAMDRLGVALSRQDRHDDAERLLRDALDQRRRLLGDAHAATATSLEHLATLHQARNEYAAAEPLFREALAVRRALPAADEVAIAQTVGYLALLRWQQGDFAGADSLYREVYEIERERLGETHPKTAQTLHNMAQAAQLMGLTERADTLYRAALAAKRASLGDAHPSVTVNLNNLGRMLAQAGRADEAEPLIREALMLDRRIFGDRHSYVGQSLNNLGLVLRMQGELDEAERVYRESLAVNLELFGEEHTFVALNWNEIAGVLHLRGDLEGAARLYRQSRDMYARLLGESHMSAIVVGTNLGRVLRESGRLDEAGAIFDSALRRLDPARSQDRAAWMLARLGMGQILADRGAHAEARPMLEEALEVARAQFGVDGLRTVEAEVSLAECLLNLDARAAAVPLLDHANSVLTPLRRAQPRLAARAEAALARARRHTEPRTSG